MTWLPRTGATIGPGQRLFAVDGEPVVLFDGEVPAWRTLKDGVEPGEDIRQLERNLATLGLDPGTVNEDFTPSTAAAVKRWQQSWDLEETGDVELGRVVFLPGARRIGAVKATLGGTGAAGGSGEGMIARRRVSGRLRAPRRAEPARGAQRRRCALPARPVGRGQVTRPRQLDGRRRRREGRRGSA